MRGCSGWCHVQVLRRETPELVLSALQNELSQLGGAVAELRTDKLSAAVRKLRDGERGGT